MRLCLVVDCYLPSTKSSAKLMHDLAAQFSRDGHEVLIVCPDESIAQSTLTREGKFEVLRVKTADFKNLPRWRRAIHEARLSDTFWKAGRDIFTQRRCDLVVFYSPSIFFGRLVERLKSLWDCPSYLILRDIFPQWAVDAGLLKKRLAWWYFRQVELRQYAAADVIGVQSPANLEYFQQTQSAPNTKLDVLYNWAASEEVFSRTNYRQSWGLDDRLVFFYGGNLGVAQDLDNLLRLAARLKSRDDIRLLFVGEGSEAPRLAAEITRQDLHNVILKPALSQAEYLGLVHEVDVGLISLDRKLRTQNVPGKILSYFAAGVPTLASLNPGNDLGNILIDAQAGRAVQNGDDDGLYAAAIELADNSWLRQSLGQRGRKLLETTFSVDSAARQILAHFQTAARSRRAA